MIRRRRRLAGLQNRMAFDTHRGQGRNLRIHGPVDHADPHRVSQPAPARTRSADEVRRIDTGIRRKAEQDVDIQRDPDGPISESSAIDLGRERWPEIDNHHGKTDTGQVLFSNDSAFPRIKQHESPRQFGPAADQHIFGSAARRPPNLLSLFGGSGRRQFTPDVRLNFRTRITVMPDCRFDRVWRVRRLRRIRRVPGIRRIGRVLIVLGFRRLHARFTRSDCGDGRHREAQQQQGQQDKQTWEPPDHFWYSITSTGEPGAESTARTVSICAPSANVS